MKIKYKAINNNCIIKANSKGEWVDLKVSEDIRMEAPSKNNFDFKIISLGIAMHLPKYFEANIVPRSSTFKNFGLISANSFGVVDNTYCGNNDIWGFPAIALRKTLIVAGNRICQFRIRPSQFAPWYIKLKWLFTSNIEFIKVNDLGNVDRGGFGSTGI